MSETMLLPVKLTQDELLAKGKSVAEKARNLSKLKSGLKDSADSFKQKIKLEEAEQAELLRDIGNGTEQRHVDVMTRFFLEEKKAEVERLDTGEIVDTRAMTPHEIEDELKKRQADLFPPEAAGGEKKRKPRKAPGKNDGAPPDDAEITSLTVSTPDGKSVTLTGEKLGAIANALENSVPSTDKPPQTEAR